MLKEPSLDIEIDDIEEKVAATESQKSELSPEAQFRYWKSLGQIRIGHQVVLHLPWKFVIKQRIRKGLQMKSLIS